ncbi:helix-turn-helix transcriptional regulator [Candidatus Woesearchaeota archaeon]|nr:helix-turn-helix transcriptional regulator [Candidatus Pacearchaeota archaeon]MBS3157258.1 helix-turn-helix transcriptional regulator [Candidatus Woesearchaeota archaeon]
MEEKKFLLISMDDEKAKALADVLGSKTCKKIIDLLAETKDASEKDIAETLTAPINTIEYNLNKLLNAGIIEKAKAHFWSTKGKKIVLYKLSNKSIIISSKPMSKVSLKLKAILPTIIISAIGTFLVKFYVSSKDYSSNITKSAINIEEVTSSLAQAPIESVQGNLFFTSVSPAWTWFLIGALFALIVYSILNWRKL